MKTTLTVRELAAVKRNAQNVATLVAKKNRILEKAQDLQAEYEDLMTQINAYEAGTKAVTGGYVSEDLVHKVVEDTGKKDAKGNPIKVTKYVPNDILVFDEEKRIYNIVDPKKDVLAGVSVDVPEETPIEIEDNTEENKTFDPTNF